MVPHIGFARGSLKYYANNRRGSILDFWHSICDTTVRLFSKMRAISAYLRFVCFLSFAHHNGIDGATSPAKDGMGDIHSEQKGELAIAA